MHLGCKMIIQKGTENFFKIQGGKLVASPTPDLFPVDASKETVRPLVYAGTWPDDVLLVDGTLETREINPS